MSRKISMSLYDRRGFTLVEVLVASMILIVALLTLASMFPIGYRQIADAGRLTVATTGARHILEDVAAMVDAGTTPFARIDALNNFDTTNPATLLAPNDAALSIPRRWRYMLAGPGDGFSFSSAETTAWGTVTPFGGNARIWVNDATNCPGPASANLRRVCVTVTVPSQPPTTVNLSTVIVSLF